MKTAFISTVHGHRWPGSEYLWSESADKLLALGHKVFAAVSRDCQGAAILDSLIARGLTVQYVRLQRSRWSRFTDSFKTPFGKLNAFAPDLIIVSSGSAFDPAYQPALAEFLHQTTKPFIFICHFNAETFWVDDAMRSAMKRIYEKAAAAVFVSSENKRITERQLAMNILRSHIIPPPLRLDLKESLPWPDHEKNWRLACVARLEPRWKGQDILLEVLSDAKWRQRNYILNLFGQGSEEQYLRRLVKHFALEKQVFFCGHSADTQGIWSNHHLQLLPAVGEGGPMVITEGMMCGRAAVTTCCGHNIEYIADGENGFLAAFATPDCFGRKLEEAWTRRHEWREMGIQAHAQIRQHLKNFAAPEKFVALIQSLKN